MILPARGLASQPAGFIEADYPQGTGYGTMRISKAGIASFTGTLADGTPVGTPVTVSAPLAQHSAAPQLTWPMFSQLYNKGGFLSATVVLNAGDADSDLSATGTNPVLWARPYQDTQHYPYGWPEVIKVDLFGAKYAATANQSVLPGWVSPDADGNARLDFTDGLLSGPRSASFNLSASDVMSKITGATPTDANLTLTVTRSSGVFSGVFTHSDGTKPAFKGVIFQKNTSTYKGGHGWFLSTTPAVKDYAGEGGKVELKAK